MYLPHLADREVSDSRRPSSTAALNIESQVTVPVMEQARRTDNINTYQYGVCDGVWEGVIRDKVGIDVRSGSVVRFELGESGDSRSGNRIKICSEHEFPKLQSQGLQLHSDKLLKNQGLGNKML